MGQKPAKKGAVADLVVSIPYGGFDPQRVAPLDAQEYPGLPAGAYYPTDRAPGLQASRNPLPPQAPRAGVMGVLGAPTASVAGLLESLITAPGDLKRALPAAGRALAAAPFQEAPPTPSSVLRDRGVNLEGVPAMVLDMFLDPTNLAGGDPTDILKAGVVAGTGGAKVLKGLYSRIVEDVLPRLRKTQHPNAVRSVLKSFASAEEVAATGLEDFLAARGDKPVTADEVAQHLEGNALTMRETVRGTDPQGAERSAEKTRLDQTLRRAQREAGPMTVWAQDSAPPEVVDLFDGVGESLIFEDITPTSVRAYITEKVGEDWADKPLAMPDGLPEEGRLVELGTGRDLGIMEDVADTHVVLDGRTGRAMINTGGSSLGSRNTPATLQDLVRVYATLQSDWANAEHGLSTIDEVLGKNEFAGPAKYAQYTLPGDKRNYREILVQMPKDEAKSNAVLTEFLSRHAEDFGLSEDVKSAGGFKDHRELVSQVVRRASNGMMSTDSSTAQARLGAIAEEGAKILEFSRPPGPRFKSGHWQEEDIVTHLRVDERDVAGQPALFVEEIQSDWDQAAREAGGYKDPAAIEAAKRDGQAAIEEVRQMVLANTDVQNIKDLIPTMHVQELTDLAEKMNIGPQLDAANRRIDEAMNAISRLERGIADQPFKGTKATELGVKRALLQAVDQGLDQVAWTTGRQQAARYGKLLADVTEVRYNPDSKSLRVISNSGGQRTIDDVKPEQIKDYIGKENANRLMQSRFVAPATTLEFINPTQTPEVSKATFDQLEKNYTNVRQFIDARTLRVKKPVWFLQPKPEAGIVNTAWWDGDSGPQRALYASDADAQEALKTYAERHPQPRFQIDTSAEPLTIGSRGMNQQYDETMVAQFNKLGKPYGAKAELVPIEGMLKIDKELFSIEEGSDGRRNPTYYVTTDDLPPWVMELADERFTGAEFSSERQARRAVDDFINEVSDEDAAEYATGAPKSNTDKVWRFPIPEKMRDDLITKGLPLLSIGGVAAGMSGEDEPAPPPKKR